MVEAYRVSFTPIEPAHFGYAGEFSPSARGPAALGRVFYTPLPSTILGALAYISCIVCSKKSDGKFSTNYNLVKEFLGTDFYLKGPYLVVNNKDILFILDDIMVKFSKEYIEKYIKMKIMQIIDKKKVAQLKKEFPKAPPIVKFLGVGLKRGLKVSWKESPGLLYLAEYVDYPSIIGKKVYGTTIESISVNYDVIVEETIQTIPYIEYIRLGGESRLAKFSISSRPTLFDKAREMLKEKTEEYWIILLSPAVTDLPQKVPLENLINLKSLSKLLSEDIEVEYILGRLSTIGLGFNEVKKERRPIKVAVPPGTVLLAKVDDPEKILKEGLGIATCDGIDLRKIGYGTAIIYPEKGDLKKLLV